MPATVRMPSEKELPPGPRRDLVEELFHHYRAAHRPSFREISDRIQNDQRKERTGTASRETIRRMLRGTVVPTWPAASTVFTHLCEMAGRDPQAERWPDSGRYESVTYSEAFENVWNAAMDADPVPPRAAAVDPWASAPTSNRGGYSDEPPF